MWTQWRFVESGRRKQKWQPVAAIFFKRRYSSAGWAGQQRLTPALLPRKQKFSGRGGSGVGVTTTMAREAVDVRGAAVNASADVAGAATMAGRITMLSERV
jgi:hypothetical protein